MTLSDRRRGCEPSTDEREQRRSNVQTCRTLRRERSGAAPVELAPSVWWVGAVRPRRPSSATPTWSRPGSFGADRSRVGRADRRRARQGPPGRAARVDPLGRVPPQRPRHRRRGSPDFAALPRPDVELVTEWRAQTLLHHYHAGFPYYLVEQHDWQLPLGDEPAAAVRADAVPALPRGDVQLGQLDRRAVQLRLFGGFTDGSELFAARHGSYFEAMRPFHEHYMPSREILRAGLARIRRTLPPITVIAPQHGCIIPASLVDEMFDRLVAARVRHLPDGPGRPRRRPPPARRDRGASA